MKITFYPDYEDIKEITSIDSLVSGSIGRLFKDLKKEKPPKLWIMVRNTMEKVTSVSNLDMFKSNEWVKHIDGKIWEFRIPPTKQGGVIRLYFGYKAEDHIIILSGERKTKKEADQNKIDDAKKRYKEVCPK